MTRFRIFLHSVAFVLGFSVIFSLLGVILNGVIPQFAYTTQKWLSYLGGIIIMLFGIYLLGLIKLPFLEREYKFKVKNLSFPYLTSFTFGAAFAVGWTPCVGAVLGAILTLAITQPGSALSFLFAYSLGLGVPFLLVGIFLETSSKFIGKIGNKLKYFNYFFGILLIVMGILVFTNRLSSIASFPFLVDLFSGESFQFSKLGIAIAFLGGLASFLSPCVLPLVPAFLSYLAVTSVREAEEK